MVQKTWNCVLPKNIIITTAGGSEVKSVATYLQKKLVAATGYKVAITEKSATSTIHLSLNKSNDNSPGKEGYTLSVTGKNISIKANGLAGVFLWNLNLAAVASKRN